MEIDYNKLATEVHAENVKKGFYDKEPERSMTLLLVVSELMEMIEADRIDNKITASGKIIANKLFNGNVDDCPPLFKEVFKKSIKDTIEDEAADVIIRLLDYAGWQGIDLTHKEDVNICAASEDLAENIWVIITLINEHRINNKPSIYSILRNCDYAFRIILNIDTWKHVELKRKYNALRPQKNGKKY